MGKAPASPQCPECGSRKVWRDGLRYLADGSIIQRYICRECGFRFSDPSKSLKSCGAKTSISNACQERALLAEVQKEAVGLRGPTVKQKIRGKILEFLWWLQKNGRNQVTIGNYRKFLNRLLRQGLNLLDPEELKGFIAKAKWKPSTKITAVRMLNVWFRFLKIEWNPPKYTPETTIPFIPTEDELNQLIAGVGKKTATYLQLLKETGARPGEISKLTWADIDFERRTIRIKPEKGSLPRILPLSVKAIEMLKSLPRKNERIFPPVVIMQPTFRLQRNKLAKKLCNPRLRQITFKTFRHWKGTVEYHKTKDIMHVKSLLGHKELKSTQVYVHIERAIYGASNEDEFHVKTAKTEEEIKELLEAGFEYVFTHEGIAYFRKRK